METVEITKEEAIRRFKQIYDLTFLDQEKREKDLENELLEQEWTLDQILSIKLDSAKRSNWSKHSVVEACLKRGSQKEVYPTSYIRKRK